MESKKLSLFDLQRLAFDTEAELEENGGELTPEIEEALATTAEQIPQKIDAYKSYLDFLDNRAKLLDDTIKQLQAKKKAAQNAKEHIREYVASTMEAFGLDKIKGEIYTATLRNTTGYEVDEDMIKVPYYKDIEQLADKLPPFMSVEVKISKTALKQAIKEDGIIPAGVSQTTSRTLTIR